MEKTLLICASLLLAASAQAGEAVVTGQELADHAKPLDVGRIRAWLAAGAEVEHTAPSTGSVRRWTQAADGTLLASSRSVSGKPVTASGTWSVRDNGSYCLTINWASRDENNCYQVFSMDGSAYLAPRQVAQNPEKRYGRIVVVGVPTPAHAAMRPGATSIVLVAAGAQDAVLAQAPAAAAEPAAPPPASSAQAPAAESQRVFLGSEEVRQRFVDHRTVHRRTQDGAQVAWDIRGNGMLYANNFTQNSKDSAAWTLSPDGGLCLKWRGNSNDGCFYTFRDGDHWARSASRSADAPIHSVIVELN
ncbi:hypothetical protein GT347_27105 [Xylophilus rhododendri]|uniref:Uncharacterized protein n=1 Tax=Xylophilus rhododendri TaxID=2697032 RepID=A0A857JEG2_9BURK|nr:hypothetical protein [Xylophilus rhododendri]QHJ01333.1 hypothetical protein GT347_27105 [Xylophilus rhododendri]